MGCIKRPKFRGSARVCSTRLAKAKCRLRKTAYQTADLSLESLCFVQSVRKKPPADIFCIASQTETGTLCSPPFIVLQATDFRGVSFLRSVVVPAAVVCLLCTLPCVFRFSGHVVSTKQRLQCRGGVVETILRQSQFRIWAVRVHPFLES